MASAVRRSPCQTIPHFIKNSIPAALILLAYKVSTPAVIALSSCALIKSGLSDMGRRHFTKGFVKTLTGAVGFFLAHELSIVGAADCSSSIPLDKRLDDRLAELAEENLQLSNRVTQALQNGGGIIFTGSSGGLYMILSKLGQFVAIFKPEEERTGGPKNRLYQYRTAVATIDDIYFLQLNAMNQGEASSRQNLARILDFAQNARLAVGFITEMESDQFFDLDAALLGAPQKKQKKMGYLQEWLEDTAPLAASRFNNTIFENPIVNRIPLDEFQEAAINSILLYTEDGHVGNYLYKNDTKGIPHLRPVDMDMILPWKLNNYQGIASHNRSREKFTQNSLKLIEKLDPSFVREAVRRSNLSEQAEINAQALALVLQKFSAKKLTLSHIYRFITPSKPDTDSPVWKMILQSKATAIQALPKADQSRYKDAELCRRTLWQGASSFKKKQEELNHYRQHHAPRINQAIDEVFWKEFIKDLDRHIASYNP